MVFCGQLHIIISCLSFNAQLISLNLYLNTVWLLHLCILLHSSNNYFISICVFFITMTSHIGTSGIHSSYQHNSHGLMVIICDLRCQHSWSMSLHIFQFYKLCMYCAFSDLRRIGRGIVVLQ